MVKLNENTIEKFIRDNKNKFGVYRPPENHLDRFVLKLHYRIREIIDIVPYLIKVGIVTVIIFISSVIVWNNFIRKDRHEVTLRNKISHVIMEIAPKNQRID